MRPLRLLFLAGLSVFAHVGLAQSPTGAPSDEPSPRWFADVHVGALVIPSISGVVTYNLSAGGGYRLLPQHAVGLGVRSFGYGGAYNNGSALGAGLRYRYAPARWLVCQVEVGPVLAGTDGGDFTESAPAGVGGAYGALHLDYRTRVGFTAGVYFAAASGYPVEQRFYSFDIDDYEPAVVREGACTSLGIAVGWTFPPLPRR